jgi:hypothetical protein
MIKGKTFTSEFKREAVRLMGDRESHLLIQHESWACGAAHSASTMYHSRHDSRFWNTALARMQERITETAKKELTG